MPDSYDSSADDADLFCVIKRQLNRCHPSRRGRSGLGRNGMGSYAGQAELLWSGRHYLLVRTGPLSGQRKVYLYSREYLLLKRGNPGKNAMIEIALASMDPVHKKWSENRRKRLWSSGLFGAVVEELSHLRGKRWSKNLRAELIAYAQNYDAGFEDRLAAVTEEFDEQARRRRRVTGLFKKTRHCQATNSHFVEIRDPSGRRPDSKLTFSVRDDGYVSFHLSDNKFSVEEFAEIAAAVNKIINMREAERSSARRRAFCGKEE